MSSFNQILESQLNTTDLLRIRIKHDPANKHGELKDYVGYVLEEDGCGGIMAIAPDISGNTINLQPDQFEFQSPCDDQVDSLARFKQHVVSFLMTRGYHDKVAKHIQHIINANNPTQLEVILKSCDFDMNSILDMYRDYANETI